VEPTVNNSCAEVVTGLRKIGYDGALLEENYKFPDWFTPGTEERQVVAAAFGQTPVSYDSACIGVACANGFRDAALVDRYRALGAPILLEIDREEIREWAVSRTPLRHGLVQRYPSHQIDQMFANRAADWRRESLFRAKNIGSFHWNQQLGLFSGLLPELEDHIQNQLDPLLRDALATTRAAYRDSAGREPSSAQLFKLVFWILTAKVFHDRRVNRFDSLGADPEELLDAVAKQYKTNVPSLLNKEARQVAANGIWSKLDFRNLSVEVLSQIWSTTLVDDETKRRLGLHRTSRTIVRYVIERIPFERSGDDKQIILEPCSGSAVFLVGAMNALRQNLFGMTPAERHKYFVQHLAAIEKDPFGVEISRLALTLADFPNAGGWDIARKDVFEPGALTEYLRRAGVVLCNPPFEDFAKDERERYQPSTPKKPAELLHRVLSDLHPSGVIGFVLPRNIIDGQGYGPIRKLLVERFATLEITILPDRAFETDSEIALLIATDPIPHHACRVTNLRVNDDEEAWEQFELGHKVSAEYTIEFGLNEGAKSLAVPELPDLWNFLINYPPLSDFAELHRGIEWKRPLTKDGVETGHRSSLVRKEPAEGFKRGVAPKTRFNVFEKPHMLFLSMKPNDQRGNSWQFEWKKPKAILNKSARSRGHWRMAAFPDSEGVVCYQTYIAVWPKSDRYDEWLLSAILNSPVANAFVSTREGKTDITMETLKLVPVPHFTESQRERLRSLIRRYQGFTRTASTLADPERLLKEIDALVLDGYRMPPRLERQLLDFFRGQARPTSHSFSEYIPKDCGVYFSLSEYLSPDFAAATSGELVKRLAHG
jgi:N-6 DNA methylase